MGAIFQTYNRGEIGYSCKPIPRFGFFQVNSGDLLSNTLALFYQKVSQASYLYHVKIGVCFKMVRKETSGFSSKYSPKCGACLKMNE